MNSIAIYCCHEVFDNFVPMHWPHPDTHAATLTCNILGVSCWVAIAYYWHERGVFYKI